MAAEPPQRAWPEPPAAVGGPPPERDAGPPVRATASTRAASVDTAPAIGSIRELRDATDAIGRRWKDEAERLLGRAVRVFVVNFEQPEVGVISRVTDDGLILEHAGQELGVVWRFVSRIELYVKPDAAPDGV